MGWNQQNYWFRSHQNLHFRPTTNLSQLNQKHIEDIAVSGYFIPADKQRQTTHQTTLELTAIDRLQIAFPASVLLCATPLTTKCVINVQDIRSSSYSITLETIRHLDTEHLASGDVSGPEIQQNKVTGTGFFNSQAGWNVV